MGPILELEKIFEMIEAMREMLETTLLMVETMLCIRKCFFESPL